MDNPFESPTSVLRHASRSGMESPPTAALFALSDASPETVRRTLEAHYAEIHKRLELVSKLGDSLRKQKKELGERLKEVEAEVDGNEKDGDGDSVLDSSLKEKLIELEKEYNEVGRESARAFLSNKPLGAVGHTVAGSQVRYFILYTRKGYDVLMNVTIVWYILYGRFRFTKQNDCPISTGTQPSCQTT